MSPRPIRWRDDPANAPQGASELLRVARPPSRLDAAGEARLHAKLSAQFDPSHPPPPSPAPPAGAAPVSAAVSGAAPKLLAVALVLGVAIGVASLRRPFLADAPAPRIAQPHRAPAPPAAPRATAPPPSAVIAARPPVVSTPSTPADTAAPPPPPPAVDRPAATPSPPHRSGAGEAPASAQAESPDAEAVGLHADAVALAAAERSDASDASVPHRAVAAVEDVPSDEARRASDSLADEAAAIALIRSRLVDDLPGAHTALAAYDQRWTRGQLRDERDYLEFEIARRRGAANAVEVARRFQRAHPGGEHAAAVADFLGGRP